MNRNAGRQADFMIQWNIMQDPDSTLPPPDPDPEPMIPPFLPEPGPDAPDPDVMPQLDPAFQY